MTEFEVTVVDRLDCRLDPIPWRFALERAAEIDAHWQEIRARLPATYNGQVFLQHAGARVEDDAGLTYRSRYLQTDYKTFLAWRDFGRDEAVGIRNCFSMAALESADGAFIAGEMAAHTAAAGKVYFAAGTPEPADLRGTSIDLEASVHRELEEETGIKPSQVRFSPGWTLVIGRHQVACMKHVVSPLPAAELTANIHAFLASQQRPELSRMHVLRSMAELADLDAPAFMSPYLAWAFARRQDG